MYDVIVVGARCGGSPTAMLLARRGHRVLLLDRASFPSDVVSTHHVTTPGIARLARWGLLGQVVASGCPPIRRMTFESGGIVLTGTPPPVDGVADQYCVRRTVLDTILAGAAVEAGAELWEGFVVGEVAFDGDRVLGVRGRSPRGADVLAVAPLVVGADGLHSLVAQEVEAPRFAERPPLTCSCYAYWRGVAPPGGRDPQRRPAGGLRLPYQRRSRLHRRPVAGRRDPGVPPRRRAQLFEDPATGSRAGRAGSGRQPGRPVRRDG
jgi:flavin-dependent dehydrogenase